MPVSQGKVQGVCRVVLSLQDAASIQVIYDTIELKLPSRFLDMKIDSRNTLISFNNFFIFYTT